MPTRRPTAELLDDLLKQREQLKAKIEAVSARARVEAKRDEDRLIRLLGALVYEKLVTTPELQAFVARELPARLTDRDRQRGLWRKLFPDAGPGPA